MYFKLLYLGFKIYCFLFRPIRIGVRMVMIQRDEVLLIRHTYLNGWYMPGGGIKRNETLEQAARREAHEETGAELKDETARCLYEFRAMEDRSHRCVFMQRLQDNREARRRDSRDAYIPIDGIAARYVFGTPQPDGKIQGRHNIFASWRMVAFLRNDFLRWNYSK